MSNKSSNPNPKRKALIAVIVCEQQFLMTIFIIIGVAIGSFALGFWYKGTQTLTKDCLSKEETKKLISSGSKPTQQIIQPPQKQEENIKSDSPEIQLKKYVRSMYNRDWDEVKNIYPTINQKLADKWLNGKSQEFQIRKIQVVSIIQKTNINDTEQKITAKLQYCRRNKTGFEEIKDYNFRLQNNTWILVKSSQGRETKFISC
jgi:hypothetical protein